eukprot:COSAG01_NODE_256_length_20138_cov_24.233694_20_plen_64_part_00
MGEAVSEGLPSKGVTALESHTNTTAIHVYLITLHHIARAVRALLTTWGQPPPARGGGGAPPAG